MAERLRAVTGVGAVSIAALACADLSSPPPPTPVAIPGQLAFVSDRHLGQEDIYVMDSAGSVQQLTTSLGQDDWPSWSPDGLRIAFESERGTTPDSINFDVVIMNADGTGTTARKTSTSWIPRGRSSS